MKKRIRAGKEIINGLKEAIMSLKGKRMKVYMAFKDASSLMEGTFQDCLGIFDSEEKAWDYLKTTSNFEYSEWTKKKKSRVYHFDGELSYYWYVKEVELNKGRDNE